jgi:DNA-binding MarR family transcriptional regulator
LPRDNVQSFLEISNKLNTKTLSLTRLQVLTLLAYFNDGIQYRELKTALNISDGKLISNLKLLRAMKYIDCFPVKIDNKTLDVYRLTREGREELEKTASWMKLAEGLVQIGGVENAE